MWYDEESWNCSHQPVVQLGWWDSGWSVFIGLVSKFWWTIWYCLAPYLRVFPRQWLSVLPRKKQRDDRSELWQRRTLHVKAQSCRQLGKGEDSGDCVCRAGRRLAEKLFVYFTCKLCPRIIITPGQRFAFPEQWKYCQHSRTLSESPQSPVENVRVDMWSLADACMSEFPDLNTLQGQI